MKSLPGSIDQAVARKPVRQLEPVRDRIAQGLLAHGIPGLAVAVARDGEILWEEGIGWADRAAEQLATAHTPFSLASVTKPITAAAVLMLAERSLIDLDRPVGDYLGGLHLNAPIGSAADATVRRIANHTAGLPLHYQFFYEDEPFRRPGIAETMRRYATVTTPPGERFNYSNLGYGILDRLISVVSGTDYPDFLRHQVFEPLGMRNSSVDPDAGSIEPAATRYGADGVPYPYYDFDHPGGSAVFASAHDLLRFAMAHLGTPLPDQRGVLSDASRAMTHQDAVQSAVGARYGIGWGTIEDEGGYPTHGHTGAMGGVSTVLAIVPSEHIAVVVLSNGHSFLPQWARIEVLGALLPGYEERKDEVAAMMLRQAMPPGEAPGPDVLGELSGVWEGSVETYQGARPMSLDIRADAGIRARLGTQAQTPVDDIRWDGRRLVGVINCELGTDDASRRLHHVVMDLRRRGDVLDGSVTALTQLPDGEGGAPGRRAGNALSHWVRLEAVGG